MEYRQLLNFLSVCEEKSFSKATERRLISQQGLSKSIKQLEEQLEVPLFYRSPGGIELTEFGQALRMAAQSHINQHDHIVDTIRQLKEKSKLFLSIGMAAGFHDILPPQFYKNFILQHPAISLNIMSFADDLCQDAMLEHKMHLGFSSGPINTNLFDSIYRDRSKVIIIAGKQHRLAGRKSIQFKELQNETIITLNNHMHPQSLIREMCAQNGFKPAILLNSSEKNLVYELCSTNQVVSFWAEYADISPDLVRIALEDVDLYWEFHFIVNKHAYISDAGERFIAYTKKQLHKW